MSYVVDLNRDMVGRKEYWSERKPSTWARNNCESFFGIDDKYRDAVRYQFMNVSDALWFYARY